MFVSGLSFSLFQKFSSFSIAIFQICRNCSMASSQGTRCMYKFPITVQVRNNTKKGHRLLPWHVAAEYRLLI